jgi:hypothetical protein
MVRTYWLVQVFNEASWNLDLQPDRTDDQVESDSSIFEENELSPRLMILSILHTGHPLVFQH